MSKRTYSVTVEIDRDEDLGDRAVVMVAGHRYRYPWHWEDNLKSLARRALTENYRVETIESVELNRRGRVPGATFLVTATVY